MIELLNQYAPLSWITLGTVLVLAAAVISYFVPPLRRYSFGLAGLVIAVLAVYLKGVRDQSKRQEQKAEKAIKKAEEKYQEIDKRPDTIDEVEKRLEEGRF